MMTTKPITERRLCVAFADIVAHQEHDTAVPRLPVFFTEFEARQGRADYVGVACNAPALHRAAAAGWGRLLARPAGASVYAQTSRAARTPAFLAARSGLTHATVRSCLADQVDAGLLKETATGSVRRAGARLPEPEVWAFEIKVSDWRRALFQALQYQAFAHRVAVVMAADFIHRVADHRALFHRLGVGLLALDATRGASMLTQSVAPRLRAPSSGAYRLHALGRIIDHIAGAW